MKSIIKTLSFALAAIMLCSAALLGGTYALAAADNASKPYERDSINTSVNPGNASESPASGTVYVSNVKDDSKLSSWISNAYIAAEEAAEAVVRAYDALSLDIIVYENQDELQELIRYHDANAVKFMFERTVSGAYEAVVFSISDNGIAQVTKLDKDYTQISASYYRVTNADFDYSVFKNAYDTRIKNLEYTSDAPMSQSEMQKKFAVYNTVETDYDDGGSPVTRLTVFSDEQLAELYSGEYVRQLTDEEKLFLINDSIQAYFKYDCILLNDAMINRTEHQILDNEDYLVECYHGDLSELDFESANRLYCQMIHDIYNIIFCRLCTLDFEIHRNFTYTAFMSYSITITFPTFSHSGIVTDIYVPHLLFDPGEESGKSLFTDKVNFANVREKVIFPTAELEAMRPVRRQNHSRSYFENITKEKYPDYDIEKKTPEWTTAYYQSVLKSYDELRLSVNLLGIPYNGYTTDTVSGIYYSVEGDRITVYYDSDYNIQSYEIEKAGEWVDWLSMPLSLDAGYLDGSVTSEAYETILEIVNSVNSQDIQDFITGNVLFTYIEKPLLYAGSTFEEVRNVLGEPEYSANDRTWFYASGRFFLSFTEDGKLISVCSNVGTKEKPVIRDYVIWEKQAFFDIEKAAEQRFEEKLAQLDENRAREYAFRRDIVSCGDKESLENLLGGLSAEEIYDRLGEPDARNISDSGLLNITAYKLGNVTLVVSNYRTQLPGVYNFAVYSNTDANGLIIKSQSGDVSLSEIVLSDVTVTIPE